MVELKRQCIQIYTLSLYLQHMQISVFFHVFHSLTLIMMFSHLLVLQIRDQLENQTHQLSFLSICIHFLTFTCKYDLPLSSFHPIYLQLHLHIYSYSFSFYQSTLYLFFHLAVHLYKPLLLPFYLSVLFHLCTPSTRAVKM